MWKPIAFPVFLLLVLIDHAAGGGGPETTLVVVNAGSPVSRRVANEYVKLRDIPPSHVVELEGLPDLGTVTLPFFRDRIWAPIRKHIEAHGLEGQIDLVTYSADFPYAVDFRTALDGRKPGRGTGRLASLTGVTYLIQKVLAGEEFWNLQANRYFRLTGTSRPPPGRAPTATEQAAAARAEAAMRTQDYTAAVDAFVSLLSTHPGTFRIWYNYACCLARKGKSELAIDALGRAADMGFNDASLAATDVDLLSVRARPQFKAILSRMRARGPRFLRAHGFRSTYAWTGGGVPSPDAPRDAIDRYYLSTQLAYTGSWGNSVPEVLGYLRSAAASDATRPDGTVYICRNSNVRSTARERFFPALMGALKSLGRKVELLENAKLPSGKQDVIGAVVGSAGFSWGSSKARMLPGAICEHLTSFGARFDTPGQTKLTEFLRYGAAGASGTVQEPLAIHMKFPNPMIHAFYAEGASLAEAFYQSIWGPYQLMVAGDGLARPFATFADVHVEAPAAPWKGTVTIGASAKGCDLELWVDGRRVSAGGAMTLDTTTLEDGHHDVRVVAVNRDAIETRTHVKLDAVIMNGRSRGTATLVGKAEVAYGERFELRAKGAREIRVLCGTRTVAESKSNRVTVDTTVLGPGPVSVVPWLVLADGSVWRAEPVGLVVVSPTPIAAEASEGPYKPGLRGRALSGTRERTIVITNLGGPHHGLRLREQFDARGTTKIELEGEIEARVDGFYQFAVVGGGHATIVVAGRRLCEQRPIGVQRYLPVALAKGWHPIRIAIEPAGVPRFQILMGGDQVLTAPSLRHASLPAFGTAPTIVGAVEGKPIAIPPEGLVLSFDRTVSKLGGVTLFPAGKGAEFPTHWTVEVPASRGKWKTVKDVTILAGKGPRKKAIAFVEITFRSTRTKTLRLRPESAMSVRLTKVDVLRSR